MSPLQPEPQSPSRLFLVSNRLPVSIRRSESGEFSFSQATGGLVSGLSGLSKSTTFQWYGWPGIEQPEKDAETLASRLKDEFRVVPIFLGEELADRYYNGFSNSILWPLFHYHPGEITFREDAWQAYQLVNRLFAKTLAKDVRDGDIIWVHDFHLMLLPQMLREEIGHDKQVKIGFFLHTPFPSSEIYRILPVRKEILLGVLYCDLVGFHTIDYARHFLSSCSIVLDLRTSTSTVNFLGKTVIVAAFPIGIEPERFAITLGQDSVQERISALQHEFKHRKILVGIDRLDYVKGVPQKLRAFELFLDTNPEYVGKVVLVQVAVPTRGEVEEYRNLRVVVNELVGRINGKFGTIEYTPIHFMHQSLSFEEMAALFAVSEACVVASTRDGMNLVCFEYIACQEWGHGSLILSEFAGAAQGLSGAIVVNPWNVHDMARALHKAVSMTEGERTDRFNKMNGYIQKYTSAFWGEAFVNALTKTGEEPELPNKLWTDPRGQRIDWKGFDGEADT